MNKAPLALSILQETIDAHVRSNQGQLQPESTYLDTELTR